MLQELENDSKLPDLPDNITFEEFSSGLNKWNKKTTTLSSGRHLGHYKLLLRLPMYDLNNNNISKQILYAYYQTISIVTKLGSTLPRSMVSSIYMHV
jgi:hypothetical protein